MLGILHVYKKEKKKGCLKCSDILISQIKVTPDCGNSFLPTLVLCALWVVFVRRRWRIEFMGGAQTEEHLIRSCQTELKPPSRGAGRKLRPRAKEEVVCSDFGGFFSLNLHMSQQANV